MHFSRRPAQLPDLLRSGADTLEVELLAEKAAALGRSGERLEKALDAYRAAGDDPARRRSLAFAAAEAAHAHFIQRELSGHRSHDDVVRRLAIPPEVFGKIGARPE
ncbi:DUF6665 family protein [Chenggangzhangella methanolivorans]